MAPCFPLRSAAALVCCGASLALTPAALLAQAPEIAPELQLFVNAREAIVDHSVHRHNKREVTLGMWRGLARKLGPKYAAYFQVALTPEMNPTEVYLGTLKTIADSAAAKADGLTLKALVEKSLDGYCRSLDAYSEYADEATARRVDEAHNPDYVGIGTTFRRTRDGFLCAPFPGGAADRAGLSHDDELIEIDDAPVRAMTMLEISSHLSGKVGQPVRLKVKHKDGEIEALTVTREAVSSTPLAYQEAGGLVRISFRRINERAFEDLRILLRSLGPGRSLVLDLRGCPGGEFSAAVRIAELFLPEKTLIAKLETNAGRELETSRNRTPYRPRLLRLLQDEATGSAAELIIVALTSHPGVLKAESRGEKTFGKGVTTRPIKLERGGILTITDSRMYGPHDEFWDNEGLPPSSDAEPDAP